jgi:hydrogenase maturation protease
MNNAGTDIPRVLIVGYGNPLRGDDGIGWVAAQKLGQKFKNDSRVGSLAVHQLTPELADPISKVELVLFIDAAEGQPPGHLCCTFITPQPRRSNQAQSMTHDFDPPRLLTMARTVYGCCPQAMLFTIAGQEFAHRESLTRTVELACERLVDQIYRIVVDELEHSPMAQPISFSA